MKLSELIRHCDVQTRKLPADVEIKRLVSDSRDIQPGDLFFAIEGTKSDGHQHVEEVLGKGAAAVIGEKPNAHSAYLQVHSSRKALAFCAAAWYGFPSRDLLVLGVTGTSGKTTTTFILEGILKAAGKKVGVIGTVNFRFGSKVYPSTHTTPGPLELQALLSEMKRDGCNAVVMEVSSHALKQRRVSGIFFDGVGFLNLSPEHLDYHPDLEDYFQSKALLFCEYLEASKKVGKATLGIFPEESPYASRLMGRGVPLEPTWESNAEGIRGAIEGIPFVSQLVGGFNVENLRVAVGMAQAAGISSGQIVQGIENLSQVPGRMERISNSEGLRIWVDYAHKPDALEKVLRNLQSERRGGARLHVVFGCGGDRDRQKRPEMARIAEKWADRVVVTSDNPRTEDPAAIIQEICRGFQDLKSVQVQPDRAQAIEEAIRGMKKGDLLVIAGKGHETEQWIGQVKIPFDDRIVASQSLTRIFKNQ